MLKAPEKTKPRARVGAARKGKCRPHDPFWRRPFHPELDRAGDFILKNLEVLREEAIVRGNSG
jgi:hypothetical protein